MNYQETVRKHLAAKAEVEQLRAEELRKAGQTARANVANAKAEMLRLQAQKKKA